MHTLIEHLFVMAYVQMEYGKMVLRSDLEIWGVYWKIGYLAGI